MTRKYLVLACATAAVALTTGGCATRGALRRAVAEQKSALESERTARASADSGLATDVASLRTQLDSLRRDLGTLRTEFGAKITAMEDGVRFALPVHFAFDDATVRDTDRAALERFARVAQRYYGGATITVEGFADPAGSERYNLDLSRRRAESVRSYLATQGLGAAGEQLRAVGYGETRQVVPGAERDQAGAEENRRVVFVVETGGTVAGRLTAEALTPQS
ncbi:MAG TPA: OmpA family protein [Gemmatimonadaceae bacterium]|nr:OmpA family protein [Gemmatimonadaceae bacterium]